MKTSKPDKFDYLHASQRSGEIGQIAISYGIRSNLLLSKDQFAGKIAFHRF